MYQVQEAQNLVNNAEQQMQNAVSNMDGAVKFIIDGANEHPNRVDIISNNAASGQQANAGSQTGAFGKPTAPTTNALSQPTQSIAPSTGAFGQPSSLGGKTSAFGKPAMGGSPFSQTSTAVPAFGQAPTGPSAFGQPSQLGGGASAFGGTSQPGATSTFGRPSAFGAAQPSPWGSSQATTTAAANPSAFGQQPAAAPAAPAFGQSFTPAPGTSAFGQASQMGGNSAFGQPSKLGASSAFGQPSTLGANAPSPFLTAGAGSKSAFGQPSQLGANAPSPFAQASTIAAQPATASFGAFGKPSPAPQQASSGAFGAPSQPPAAQASSAFGQPTQQNAFGAPVQPAASNLFAAPTAAGVGTPNPFAAASKPATGANPFGALPQPAVSHQASALAPTQGNADATRDPQTNKVTSFHGQTIYYPDPAKPKEGSIKRPDGKWERVWYPDGPPLVAKEDTELPEAMYDDAIRDLYLAVKTRGTFGSGGIPFLPPKREWCSWDF